MAVIVPTLRHERRLWNEGLTRVVGVDEVGVAPTCGAVVAAAVIMRPGCHRIPGVRDSKTLSMLSVPKIHLPKRDDGVPIGSVGPDGWYRTGDLGQLDKNGRLTITGREDDLVKVDGKRVALGEVEGCLEAFPKIKAAQARVITDDMGGPMVVARVVRASMCRAEDIIDHCARNLAPYKVPRQIEFCESF